MRQISAPSRPPPKHYLAVLKAAYDFERDPAEEEEISIKKNQILLLQERVDQQWWKVKLKDSEGPAGLVPVAYVEPATHTSVVKALYDYDAGEPGGLSITEDQVLLVFDTEDNWLLVKTDEDGGKAGFVPINYVEAVEATVDAEEEDPVLPAPVPSSQNVAGHALVEENERLRTAMIEMQATLQEFRASSSDVELQRIQYEDLVRENERLNKQVTEMRESTTQLPWSGGDSELQTLINEDLARENARLQVEARETQETVAQLQQSHEEQRKLNVELEHYNVRLQESARTMRILFEAQHRELLREIERLKTPVRDNASTGPSGGSNVEVPPPAYDDAVDISLERCCCPIPFSYTRRAATTS